MINWYGKPGRAAHLPKWAAATDGFARAIATRCGKFITPSMRHVEPERIRDCCGQCVYSARQAGLVTVAVDPIGAMPYSDYLDSPAPVEVAA